MCDLILPEWVAEYHVIWVMTLCSPLGDHIMRMSSHIFVGITCQAIENQNAYALLIT